MYSKSEAQCKPWSLGDNAVSVFVLSHNKCRTLMEAIDVGGGGQGSWGRRLCPYKLYGKPLYLPLSFVVNLKLL